MVSTDRVNWVRVDSSELSDGVTLVSRTVTKLLNREPVFQFRSPVESKELWVAYSFPYSAHDLGKFLNTIRNESRVQLSVLGRSEEGREIQFISIEDNALANTRNRPSIWVVAREHPGETPASYVLEGFVDSLLNQPAGQKLLSKYRFNIIPLFNVDGASNGSYYRNAKGIDIAQDWGSFDSAEAGLLHEAIQNDIGSRNVDLVLNLHSANEPRSHFFLETPAERLPPKLATLQQRLIQSAKNIHPQLQTEKTVDLWDYPVIAGNYLSKHFSVYCLYVESNYSIGADGTVVTQDSLRDVGRSLTRAIADALVTSGQN